MNPIHNTYINVITYSSSSSFHTNHNRCSFTTIGTSHGWSGILPRNRCLDAINLMSEVSVALDELWMVKSPLQVALEYPFEAVNVQLPLKRLVRFLLEILRHYMLHKGARVVNLEVQAIRQPGDNASVSISL